MKRFTIATQNGEEVLFENVILGGSVDANGNVSNTTKVHIESSSIAVPFTEQIYSGIASDSQITDGGLEEYTYWEFHIVGSIDTTDVIAIQISLDGVNFLPVDLVSITDGAFIDASAGVGTNGGIFRLGHAIAINAAAALPMGIQAIKVNRTGTTTGATVIVTARAY